MVIDKNYIKELVAKNIVKPTIVRNIDIAERYKIEVTVQKSKMQARTNVASEFNVSEETVSRIIRKYK